MTTLACSPTPTPTALRDAVGQFGADVLGGWNARERVSLWRSPTDRKEYRQRARDKRGIRPDDVLDHLEGRSLVCAGPITRAVVVDVDLDHREPEASEQAKREGADLVGLVLDSFGIPYLTIDSARGTHTWIRLERDPTVDELNALRRLLADAATRHGLAGRAEVFPQGGKGIRLPFGVYLGVERLPLTPTSEDERLAWLAHPPRATSEQLVAMVEQAPQAPPQPERQRERAVAPPARVPESRIPRSPAPTSGPPERGDSLDLPAPLTGWDRWPACKQRVALDGPLPGRRHYTLLMLACEAVNSGEHDVERIVRFLVAMPRPHSQTPADEHESDSRAAAEAALRLHVERDARRLSSCPHVPTHSGHPQTSQHRSTFEHRCAEEARDACPIYRAWRRAQDVPAYDHIVHSTIWRGGQGAGTGLGLNAREVYTFLVRLSGGDPEHVFQASKRYVAVSLPSACTPNTAAKNLDLLVKHGLIERPDETRHDLYRVPLSLRSWVRELEARLGTAEMAERQREAIRRDWRENPHFRP